MGPGGRASWKRFVRRRPAVAGAAVVGLCVGLGSTALGTTIGAATGWCGGWLDKLLMRLTDLLMVIPALAVLMITQKGLGASMFVVVAVLTSLSWHTLARTVRAHFLSLKRLDFIEAARASGPSRNQDRSVASCSRTRPASSPPTPPSRSARQFSPNPRCRSWGSGCSLPPVPGAACWPKPREPSALPARTSSTSRAWPSITVLAVNAVGDGRRHALDPAA